jgi:hypothetical protein
VAASSIDSEYPKFQHTFGHWDDIQKLGRMEFLFPADKVQPLNIQVGLVDQADQITNCTQPYMLSLVANGTSLDKLLAGSLDFSQLVTDSVNTTKRSQGYAAAAILTPILFALDVIIKLIGPLAKGILDTIGAANIKIAQVSQNKFYYNVLNFIAGGSLGKFGRIVDYVGNAQAPVGLPTADAAAAGWLAGEIDDCTFQTYVQANDYRFTPFKAITRAGKFKFSALQLATLYKRGKIDRGTFRDRLREIGSLHHEDVAEVLSLFEQVPGPAELIRFMQRDVVNPKVVDAFNLGDGFQDNYQGRLKEVAQQQGLTDESMLWEWMAHWSIPSPTQLYEMLHRLRHNPDYGGPAKVLDDVTTALKQQDILPYWIPRLLEISYHPLTRTDLNRAYERGWIGEDAYLDGMYQNGYSDDDAKALLRFADNERSYVIRHLPEVKTYAEGYIDELQLRDAMFRQDWASEIIDDIVEEANYQREIADQRRAIDAISRQYRACRITYEEARKDAQDLGIPQITIDYHLQIAQLNTTCGTRKEWASQLGKALEERLIDSTQYVDRMKELKYDDKAIEIQLTLVENKIAQAKARQTLKQQQQEAKDQAAQQKAEEKAARDAAAQARRLAGIAASAERRRQTRNDQLAAAANHLGEKLSDVSGPPSDLVTTLYHSLQAQYGLSQDEAARVLSVSSAAAKGMTSGAYTAWVAKDALAMLAEPWQLFPAN